MGEGAARSAVRTLNRRGAQGGGQVEAAARPGSLVDGVNVCPVVGLPVHAAAPYGCGGGGDGVVLNDLLLGARRRWAPRRAALRT